MNTNGTNPQEESATAPVARDDAALAGRGVQLWLDDPEEKVAMWTQ